MALPFSTNPMTMAENIRKLEGFDGSIPIDKIPKDYSTTEQDTGVKWVDGKNIYRKCIQLTTPSDSYLTEALSFDTLIYLDGFVLNTSGATYPLHGAVSCYGSSSKNSIVINSPGSSTFKDVSCCLIVYYTKPDTEPELTASPDRKLNEAPETEAAPEAEPELKKVTKKKTTTKKEEEE